VPRGAPIREAEVVLSGLNADRFDASQGGTWNVQLLAAPGPGNLGRSNFQRSTTSGCCALFPTLFPGDVGRGVTNVFPLDPAARDWLAKQIVDGVEALIVRVTGPTAGDSVLRGQRNRAGDSRRASATGAEPRTAPANAAPFPTENVIVATDTPTPANVLTVAPARLRRRFGAAEQSGTPSSYRLVTPTPFPANLATARRWHYCGGCRDRPEHVYTGEPCDCDVLG